MQTYSFFTGSSLAVAFLATYALITRPSRQRLAATVITVAAVLLLGTFIAVITGPLPLFGLLLLATLPAHWPLIRENVGLAIATIAAFAIAASPQVLRTALGLLTRDDFLGYRQASTEDLGIDLGPALLGSLPLVLLAAIVIVSAVAKPRTTPAKAALAAIAALAVGVAIMSTNGAWGFDQEPYRFWLQYSIVGLLALSTVLPWAWKRRPAIAKPAGNTATARTAALAVTWAASLADTVAFRDYAGSEGLIAAEDEYAQTLRKLVGPDSGMVLSSACFDPQHLRLITGAPSPSSTAAWPGLRGRTNSIRSSIPAGWRSTIPSRWRRPGSAT